jgi:hypothetical protein
MINFIADLIFNHFCYIVDPNRYSEGEDIPKIEIQI